MKSCNVSNNQFTGVHYSSEHADALKVIAEGLTEATKAFHTLAKVLTTSEVKIEALLKLVTSPNAELEQQLCEKPDD